MKGRNDVAPACDVGLYVAVLELPEDGTDGFPHCGCRPPCNTRRRSFGAFGASVLSPTAFFLVLPLIRRWRLHIASLSVIHCIWKTIHLTFDYNFSKCTIHCTAQHLGPIRKWLNRSRCRLANIAGWCDVIPSFHRCCYPVMLLTSPINRQGRWLGWALGTMC